MMRSDWRQQQEERERLARERAEEERKKKEEKIRLLLLQVGTPARASVPPNLVLAKHVFTGQAKPTETVVTPQPNPTRAANTTSCDSNGATQDKAFLESSSAEGVASSSSPRQWTKGHNKAKSFDLNASLSFLSHNSTTNTNTNNSRTANNELPSKVCSALLCFLVWIYILTVAGGIHVPSHRKYVALCVHVFSCVVFLAWGGLKPTCGAMTGTVPSTGDSRGHGGRPGRGHGGAPEVTAE